MIAVNPSARKSRSGYAPTGLPEHISPSAAKSYLSCSLKFFFERVASIPRPTSPALHLGKAIHGALQGFHLAMWRGNDCSPDAISELYEQEFDRLEIEEGPVNYKNPEDREKHRLNGLRVLAAYLDSDEVPQEPPRAVEVFLKENIPGLSVPLVGALDLVESDFTPVDFKSAASRPDASHAGFDHEIQLVSYQLLMEQAGVSDPPGLDLIFLVKTKSPQVIRISSPPADEGRKQRVIRLLQTAVDGMASGRYYPQPGAQCSWCAYRSECKAWPQSLRAGPLVERRVA